MVGGALALSLNEHFGAQNVGASPSREGLEKLEALALGADLYRYRAAVFGGCLVACIFYGITPCRELFAVGSVEHNLLA